MTTVKPLSQDGHVEIWRPTKNGLLKHPTLEDFPRYFHNYFQFSMVFFLVTRPTIMGWLVAIYIQKKPYFWTCEPLCVFFFPESKKTSWMPGCFSEAAGPEILGGSIG